MAAIDVHGFGLSKQRSILVPIHRVVGLMSSHPRSSLPLISPLSALPSQNDWQFSKSLAVIIFART
jgi:hypothetical protein